MAWQLLSTLWYVALRSIMVKNLLKDLNFLLRGGADILLPASFFDKKYKDIGNI